MKKISLLLLIMASFSVSGQMEIEAKELSKKEIRALKKQKSFEKQKARYAKRGLNDWGINENAPNLVVAVREHLGSARIDLQKGLVIIRQSESFSNGQPFPLWIVDGQQYSYPPNNIAYQNIREVVVYESLAETNKWGQQGRSGVIEIKTVNSTD
tara:strand:- start:626 stop:1090 length:465 start_codon:yes stop_codon:yes gene_type:complete